MPVTNTVTAQSQQCFLDLAMQEAGSIAALFEVAQRNGMGITDDLLAGAAYVKPDLIDSSVKKVFNTILKPASNYAMPVKPEGIDYWIIEDDFIVQ